MTKGLLTVYHLYLLNCVAWASFTYLQNNFELSVFANHFLCVTPFYILYMDFLNSLPFILPLPPFQRWKLTFSRLGCPRSDASKCKSRGTFWDHITSPRSRAHTTCSSCATGHCRYGLALIGTWCSGIITHTQQSFLDTNVEVKF